jgi:rod shape determining protein RodA
VLLVFVLGLTAVLGLVGAAGAQRWLTVGIPVQPSELAKLLLVIILAQHLQNQYQKMDRIATVFTSLAYIGVPALLIFLQPSLGITILIMFTWFVMVWAAGLRLRHIAIFSLLLVVVLPVLWSRMEDYQRDRIFSFIGCSSNVQDESTQQECYNILQARISIGSGGAFGKGYLGGTQSQLRFLRVRHTDFIFSVIAEELGFVGASLVLVLMGLLLWRIMRAAALARDPLGSLLCYGVAANIFFQTFVSIGMNLSLLPVTGLTLPFVSSGGSSLLTLLFGIGLVQSVVMRHKAV